MKVVQAHDFDPVADVLMFEFGCQQLHSEFFDFPVHWLICCYSFGELASIEILEAVDKVFGKTLPTQARVDSSKREDGGKQWRIVFYDEPVAKENAAYSWDRMWYAKSSWNAKGTLISLNITRFAETSL